MRDSSTGGGTGLTFELRGSPMLATRLATLLWIAGWLATAASVASQGWLYGWSIGHLLYLAIWSLVGFMSLVALVWASAGRPEVLTVSGRALYLRRGIGPFARTLAFEGSAIRGLRVFERGRRLAAEYAAIRAFWDRGAGRIAFDVEGRIYALGSWLDDESVSRVVSTVTAHFPAAAVEPANTGLDTSRVPRRRPGWIAYVTSGALVGAFALPAQTFVTDLPICTAGALGGVYEPLDRRELQTNGRVILVPMGDFPREIAGQIAQHFTDKYHLGIEVGRHLPIPRHALDVARGQADSDALLRALGSAYPEKAGRSVVIGLTTADIFIPAANWAYAFSNRRPPRLAVVSPARMDRSCMGIGQASPERRMARLRKMVGKNIGALVYGLPLSSHPRSMMYAWVGGPQELDTMSEDF